MEPRDHELRSYLKEQDRLEAAQDSFTQKIAEEAPDIIKAEGKEMIEQELKHVTARTKRDRLKERYGNWISEQLRNFNPHKHNDEKDLEAAKSRVIDDLGDSFYYTFNS